MGIVTYKDPACAVTAQLEAFSPFIPLDLENSSYPATVMRYTLKNTSARAVEATVAGWVDNPVCVYTGRPADTLRRNTIRRDDNAALLQCTAEKPAAGRKIETRPDIVFEDFEKPDYADWQVVGEAFGKGPVAIKDIPEYQDDVNGLGKRVVNSHASAPGDSVGEKDKATGSLLSRPFKIERNYIAFRIGGGRHESGSPHAMNLLKGEKPRIDDKAGASVNLLIDGKVVRSLTGHNHNKMRSDSMDVSALRGKTGRLMIVDAVSGPWGNIGVDQIVFTDTAAKPDAGPLEQRYDYGTFALATVGGADHANASAKREALFDGDAKDVTEPYGQPLIGTLGKTIQLAPGESKTITFVVAWYFPNLALQNMGNPGRWYAARYPDAAAVAAHVATNSESFYKQTRLWVDTWYDSTLPCWLLDRTMANTSTLATTVCYLFRDGRFYGWEGINCCPGTCTHVWHYAQAPGRLFPQVERILRKRVDFGIGQHADGAISHRTYADKGSHHADDGHCGRILGVYREHQMCADAGFLRELWPKVKKAIGFMFKRDPDGDGILDGAQPNTLDAAWFGKISFTSSLHIAAMRAGEQMAREMGDDQLAAKCKAVADAGRKSILELFNGEYFYQIEDAKHKTAIGAGTGCYIDQVFGQTWAYWTNLGELFDRDKQLAALRSLWKYNFVPDIGPFRERFKQGRWYANAGDAGLIMCSWPGEQVDPGKKKHWQYGYFNECMTGFEWQAAAHMIWEGHDQPDLLKYGLAISRAIHDRYNATLRNPYNEIECSDHYARAMASYGVFQAVCGFNCHGPAGHIEFIPRLTPDDFRAAFTAAQGWGTFEQKIADGTTTAELSVKWGEVSIQTLHLSPKLTNTDEVTVTYAGKKLSANVVTNESRNEITLSQPVNVSAGEQLKVMLR
jgi:non-lysosomal glucosylceramidase